ncbi:MAG: hypothetical protein C4525_08385 [Desulfarculus sp.]|jgi:hypothetical protein|nr:MAG: hypothetical protein C4525_08385 [Desulfarculus sp.]
MKKALLAIPALVLALVLALAAVAGAAGAYDDVDDIESIKSRLEKLRVSYTDDHPSIQQLLRVLKRAQARQVQDKQKETAKSLEEALPRPPWGWRADTSQQAPEPTLGSLADGPSAARHYVSLDGGRVQVEALIDTLSIKSLTQRLNQAGAGGGDKLITWKGYKALLAQKGGSEAELQALVGNKVVLKVRADQVQYPEAVVREFADAVNLGLLRQAARRP